MRGFITELFNLYNVPEIVKAVTLGKLRWLGHLARANEISPCRKVTRSKTGGTSGLEDPDKMAG
jgi:hypothetical protein